MNQHRHGLKLSSGWTTNYTMASKPFVDREKTAPFLVRTFVKIGGFHRAEFFEDGTLPTTDEHQIFTWRDATLKEVLTSLRLITNNPDIRHPLAKFLFRSLYADSAARGRIATRDLGSVSSREILGEPGTLDAPAPRLLTDGDEESDNVKTLEELRFFPGDYLCISVALPKHVTAPDVSIRGAAGGQPVNGWKSSGPLSPPGPPGGLGRGGGHWRGGSDPYAGRGRGGRAERSRRELDRELDRRLPPPRRRDSPPHRDLYTGRDRSSLSRSRSRSPPRRRYRAHSSYSELFEQDTPEFINALCNTVFPGETPPPGKDSSNSHGCKQQQFTEIETLENLSQEFMKKISQASTIHGDDHDSDEDRPIKRLKTSDEPDFIQGSSNKPLLPDKQEEIQDDDENPFRTRKNPPADFKPLHSTDPVTPEAAARVPGYAPNKANRAAEQMMKNPEFRSTRTSAAGADFIDGFYKNSRLHYLSTWKAELRELVAEAQERADKEFTHGEGIQSPDGLDGGDGKAKEDGLVGKVNEETSSTSMRGNAFQLLRSPSKRGKPKEQEAIGSEETVIMHCDFDCFFASVGLLSRPYLKDQPVVVCHSQGKQGGESSTSEVSSANYRARESGIRAGMRHVYRFPSYQARKLCPSVATIPYEFEKYKAASLQLYTILMSHADDVQAVSVDEALVDVTTAVKQMPPSTKRGYDAAKDFAEMLRAEIKSKTGCDVSIGISHNIMLARLATRKAKPAGSYHLRLADLQKHIEHTCIDELHGFGHAAREKALDRLGAATLGELAKKPRSVLCDVFGKAMGSTLYYACRGIDHRNLESDKPRKSVSAEINYGIRFENSEQAQAFMFQLAEEVTRRLGAVDMCGRSLTLKIMKRDPDAPIEPPKFLGHGCCNIFNKQASLSSDDGRATGDALIIGQVAWRLLKSFAFDPKDLRGVGIQITKLEKASEAGAKPGELGQAKLSFRTVQKEESIGKKEREEEKRRDKEKKNVTMGVPCLTVQPPSSHSQSQGNTSDEVQEIKPESGFSSPPPAKGAASNLALPSFSQVDRSSFEALPDTLKTEIKAEYSRRSASPALSAISDGDPDRTPWLSPLKRLATNKGTPLSRITQALAPRSREGSLRSGVSKGIFEKQNIFERCEKQKEVRGSKVVVTRDELKKLGIDTRVFHELPPEVQMEQLASARFSRSFGKKDTKGTKK
ncbi:DNA/RNA polymerase [Sanghuangporus baumii]|uniref:DNA repair protein REV1 n=1 Tax=Sanghuangporus baumii TaxID=108892 RepID=A0A9Q5NB98_SANBA|nr:DNA/RNA polymerase [Sanghuangporus baumii]